jgi:hypothetical protein
MGVSAVSCMDLSGRTSTDRVDSASGTGVAEPSTTSVSGAALIGIEGAAGAYCANAVRDEVSASVQTARGSETNFIGKFMMPVREVEFKGGFMRMINNLECKLLRELHAN